MVPRELSPAPWKADTSTHKASSEPPFSDPPAEIVFQQFAKEVSGSPHRPATAPSDEPPTESASSKTDETLIFSTPPLSPQKRNGNTSDVSLAIEDDARRHTSPSALTKQARDHHSATTKTSTVAGGVKRGRGRPRKIAISTVSGIKSPTAHAQVNAGVKRKRGRPKGSKNKESKATAAGDMEMEERTSV
ncbi:MAG: hypothetical protein Q9222_002214 [Ikaeria aurantiellina]